MTQYLFLFFVEDFFDAYHAMNSSLDEHESDEVITATFVSVKLFPRIATIATKNKNGNKNAIGIGSSNKAVNCGIFSFV